ncbi:winged helix-turn-helix domain-containing protein [Halovenus rubra]|uniref:Winged helix-turn-helix domain-containing protein n=2 Tax=Halovenus rubra TaxID=869890 RepID=A0ABD5X2S0_9EURY|nr:helix-turn-helix domain-containing protein [Halovenus rubra]
MNAKHDSTNSNADNPTLQAAIGSLLADETRIAILTELYAVSDTEGLSFSTLRRQVGVSDSGRFNYHLDQLSGELVRKRDEKYTLTSVGKQLVMAFEDTRQ